ncbi:MAG: LysE family transporter [Chloroflexota bacterium]|jgi:threonine/homoserine/homoserine lactone efflux protein
MDLAIFGRGLVLGLAVAAPVGPIGLLCIQRTLQDGRIYGLVTGLGAATADGLYGLVAAFGLTFISSFFLGQQDWIALLGGLYLFYLGLRIFRAAPAPAPANRPTQLRPAGLLQAYGSTLLLTLTNPVTILSFVAIFAGLGLAQGGDDYLEAATLVLGVFCGSAAWWLFLSGGVSLIRERVDARAMLWINRLSGAIIIAFGLVALTRLVIG